MGNDIVRIQHNNVCVLIIPTVNIKHISVNPVTTSMFIEVV